MSTLSAPPLAPGRSSRRGSWSRLLVGRRSAFGLLALLACAAALLGGARAEGVPAQAPGATVTTTAVVTATTTVTTEAKTSSTRVADENRRVWVIVGGLVVVALAILGLTITYWRHTDPARVAARTASERRRSPVGDLGVSAVSAGVAEAMPRPVPEAVPEELVGEESVVDTGEIDVSDPRADDATHAGVGAGWEPRATGEQEQIVVPAVARTTRPTRDQRAIVLGVAPPDQATEPTEA